MRREEKPENPGKNPNSKPRTNDKLNHTYGNGPELNMVTLVGGQGVGLGWGRVHSALYHPFSPKALTILDLVVCQCMFTHDFSLYMQADMQPESSGCNEVKYNLNVDTIEAIFKTYPAGEERCNF